MKIIAEFENGTKTELKSLSGVEGNTGVIIAKLATCMKKSDQDALEAELTEKLGIKVVLLPSYISELYTL